jgi:hypothetical protein
MVGLTGHDYISLFTFLFIFTKTYVIIKLIHGLVLQVHCEQQVLPLACTHQLSIQPTALLPRHQGPA